MIIRLAKNGICFSTPAKLNLFLELKSKREDGFHELETVMCKWSLFDWLSIAPTNSNSIDLVVQTNQRLKDQLIPSDANNLVIKTLLMMRDLAGKSGGAEVKLFKNIPIEAGLGGASSNAAAAIVAANHIWEMNWPTQKLMEIAECIGSDVAFFLGGSLARCTGKGEQVHNLNYPCRLNVVVVKPKIGMSTGKIYSRCTTPKEPINSNAILSGLSSGHLSTIGGALFNRLEQFAENDHPAVARMRAEFNRTNCMGHQLTGSGSCYFGIFPNSRTMRAAARQLSCRLPEMNVMTGHTLSSQDNCLVA